MKKILMSVMCMLLLALSFSPAHIVNAAPTRSFNETAYQERKAQYIQEGITSSAKEALILQAYKGEELNQEALNDYLDRMRSGGVKNADFDLIKLIRVLMFRPEIKDELVDALDGFHFWFREGGSGEHVFASENHMIMYTSSQYLLQEKYDLYKDERTYQRLKKYLEVKNKYGFYEFYSGVYLPYTLSALLNLVDFAEDKEIRQLAIGASHRLLKDVLLVTNDEGSFFSAAGRTYPRYKERGQDHNINRLIYLLTGLGNETAKTPSAAGVMLATSDLPISDEVFQYFGKKLNLQYSQGHSLRTAKDTLYKDFPLEERVPFYWSQGAYFHPDVAEDTARFASKYQLSGYDWLKTIDQLIGFSKTTAPIAAKAGAAFSRSSVLSSATFSMYKDDGVMLHSLQDYWPGRQGYQQNPWIATTGTQSIWTQSGQGKNSTLQNAHLPKIKQKNNVAVIQYNPYPAVKAYHGRKGSSVWLYWPNGFEEEKRNGNWKFGKEDDGYVAVRYPCGNGDANQVTCDWNEQTWVTIVGTKEQYGSFESFTKKVVNEVDYDADWEWHGSFWKGTLDYVYDSDVSFDGTEISLTW